MRATISDTRLPGANSKSEAFRVADSHLFAARYITGKYLDTIDTFTPLMRRGVEDGDAASELFAEHGAILSLQARIGTTEQTIKKQHNEPIDHEAVQRATHRYGYAHIFLHNGNNGDYRVGNAMNAARHARLFGGLVSPWLARAESGLAWTAVHDRENFRDALLAHRSLTKIMSTRRAVKESVLQSP